MNEIRKILLVDDDDDDRAFFLEVVQTIDASMVCHIAQNGREALDKLQANDALPDIIFLDLNMPLMNGREFLSALGKFEKFRSIPVIILSTSSQESIKQETASLGARGFITKPNKFSLWESILSEFFTTKTLDTPVFWTR